MTTYLPLLALGLLAFTSDQPAPADRLGVKGPLTFNKTAFRLAWSAQPAPTYYAQEYLPLGDKLPAFKQMLALHLSDQDADVPSAVRRKVTELAARKATDVVCNYQVLTNPNQQEVILDFLLSQDVSGPASIIEFNVYRYKLAALAPHHPGVLLYAYTKRAYGKDGDAFLQTLQATRAATIAEMAAAAMPAVKISSAH